MSKNGPRRKAVAIILLQQDIGTSSLVTRAISDVLAKTLYQHQDEPLSIGRLASKAAGLANLPQIPQTVVEKGLNWLQENGWVTNHSRGWQLTQEGKEKIDLRAIESENRLKELIAKYFGITIDHGTIKSWFTSASVAFFSAYGEVISRALLREQVSLPTRAQLEKVLEESISDASLDFHKELLLNGFHTFVNDIDPRAEVQKMSFAQITVSARLIAAAAGPDPISVSDFENSKLFLDTNVLFLDQVEMGNPETARLIGALATALRGIGATLHIIRPTKEEYEGVVQRKRNETLRVLKEGVSIGVFEKSGDPFLRAAVKNGARNEDDFIRFFDSIAQAPTQVGSESVELLEFPALQTEIDKAMKDAGKKAEIIGEFVKLRGRNKSDILAEHDAALNAAALYFRKEEGKGWVITRDKSMLNLSRRWHEVDGLQAWVFLDALVQSLAVGGTGPTYNPENFAPLLGALVKSEVQDVFADFQVEDLGDLVDIDARVFELDDDEVIGFAQKVHQIKLSGADTGPLADPELQLHIRRKFQGRRIKDNVAAEKTLAQLRDQRLQTDIAKSVGVNAIAKSLLPGLRWRKRFWRWTPFLVGALVLGTASYVLRNNPTWFSSLLIALALDVLIPCGMMLFSPINKEALFGEAKVKALSNWEKENREG